MGLACHNIIASSQHFILLDETEEQLHQELQTFALLAMQGMEENNEDFMSSASGANKTLLSAETASSKKQDYVSI